MVRDPGLRVNSFAVVGLSLNMACVVGNNTAIVLPAAQASDVSSVAVLCLRLYSGTTSNATLHRHIATSHP